MRPIDLSLSYAEAIQKPLAKTRQIERAQVAELLDAGWPTEVVESEVYQPSADLVRVTDLAIALERPLLLQGEPGCGKTRLAHALAYALGLPLEIAYVKSTSRAQDLLYTYDAVRRLYDSQLGANGPVDKDGQPLVRDPGNYIELGPLGRAIARAALGRRSIVLIDEIDKADLDFPNDLLWELDRMEFDVPEAPAKGRRAGDVRPIVVITHNEEKPLPPAFLRRCVYFYVDYPRSRAEVEHILALHGVTEVPLAKRAVEIIERLRQRDLLKRPGLVELIEWVRYEQQKKTTPADLDKLQNMEALLKDRSDQDRTRKEIATL
ncbi:MoxR family ATPase [Mesorhizobium sp. M1060]|uniref:AAA family ATPase n=1 Tax=unclassified Mesorhizobium TaxID=325217 RepID=UPI0003D05C2B|nr:MULTISPECIES: MoxR family ATPase [unclassified Mesorhizobium]ESZ04288.1 ATPase AAA [Mesorhizobium sp. L2C089B000]WJI52351.1 MoxR family ATPase [Mesorhizobium sp. C089B]